MWLAETFGDKLTTGGITAGLGIGVTFLVLAVIIVIVMTVTKLSKIDFKAIAGKVFAKKGKAAETETETAESPVACDEKKLVAAISAAIAVLMSAEVADDAPKAKFIVKSIKRI